MYADYLSLYGYRCFIASNDFLVRLIIIYRQKRFHISLLMILAAI